MVVDPEGNGDPGSTLCRACGLCCGGALFSSGPLTDDEEVRLRRRLTMVEPRGAAPAFAIPCPAHGPAGCTVYDERPVTCVEYVCLLLEQVQAGDVPLPEALGKVAEIKELMGRLEADLPPGVSLWDRAGKLRAAAEPGALAERRRLAATLMDLKVLERRLARDLDDRVGRTGIAPVR